MKNIKRSLFSVVLCAMLVFCVGFYSSVEPTTAWYSDTGSQEGSFNMDEISITFEGDGIITENDETKSNTIELNFKAATKSADIGGNPEPMFEYAAEFYTFKATNESGTDVKMNVEVTAADNSGVNYKVYELGPQVTDGKITPFLMETTTAQTAATVTDTQANRNNVYIDSAGNRVLKIGDNYYDAYLLENLDTTADDLILENDEGANTKTYCIAIWVEYSDFDTVANELNSISCEALVNISAEQYIETTTN